MPQFFISNSQIENNNCIIQGKDFYHLTNVRRVAPGDTILLKTENKTLKTTVTSITEHSIITSIFEASTSEHTEKNIILYLSLLKGKSFDLAIQKATEVGVSEIVPVVTERTIPKIDNKEEKKLERWNSISYEAAKQCMRNSIPEVTPPLHFKDCITTIAGGNIIAHTVKKSHTIDFTQLYNEKNILNILIGPEGGFSDKEIQEALDHNWHPFHYGYTVLRGETAASIIPAIIINELQK